MTEGSTNRWGRWAAVFLLLFGLVLVPFALFGDQVTSLSEALVVTLRSPTSLAAWGVGLLALDIFLPIPSSLVAAAACERLGFSVGLLVVWFGLTLGHSIGYATGRLLGGAGLRRLLSERECAKARSLFDKRPGAMVLAATRGIPVLSESVILFAGATRLPVGRTLGVCALANLGIGGLYASIGALAIALHLPGATVVAAVAVPLLIVGVAILARGLGRA